MGVIELLIWLLVIETLSLSVFPLLARAMPGAPDRGYGLSKACGLLLFGIVCWLVPTLATLPVSHTLVTVVFAVFVVLGSLQYPRPALRKILSCCKAHIVSTELVFFGLTLIFLAVRFFNSEIYWGEKPMDSTFLHFFTRNESVPPQDPWAAGNQMRYYYLGVYILATLLKLTGIPVSLGYNFAIATLAGLIGAALYSVMAAFLRHVGLAIVSATSVVLSCNPEVILLLVRNKSRPTFDNLFWPSSRVFESPGFFEYTSWSLLFADLHAHVIAIPFTVCALALGLHVMRNPAERYSQAGLVARILAGICLGALSGINTWDFLSFGGVIALLIVFADVPRFWIPPRRADGSTSIGERLFATGFARVVALVWDLGLLGLVAGGFSHLFQRTTLGHTSPYWGWVTGDEFNSLERILRAVGFIILLTVGSLAVQLCRAMLKRERRPSSGSIALSIVVGLAAFFPILASLNANNTGQSWGLSAFVALVATLSCLVLGGFAKSVESRALFLLVLFSTMLILLLEHFFLFDRANTLFKGYMAVWMLGSIAAVVLVVQIVRQSTRSLILKMVIRGSIGVVLLLNVVGFVANVYSVLTMKRIPKRVYSLDGSAFLQYSAPEDYQIIKWFNERVAGTPVILEAQGPSYRNFTRVSMHTGLPTVLGWEYHVQQRGLARQEIEQRREDVASLYTSDDVAWMRFLLQKYKVDFVVVGGEERAAYDIVGQDPFEKVPHLFMRVAAFANSRIYVTYRSSYRGLFNGEGQ